MSAIAQTAHAAPHPHILRFPTSDDRPTPAGGVTSTEEHKLERRRRAGFLPPRAEGKARPIMKIDGHLLLVTIWPAAERPDDPAAVWHPAGCWVKGDLG